MMLGDQSHTHTDLSKSWNQLNYDILKPTENYWSETIGLNNYVDN